MNHATNLINAGEERRLQLLIKLIADDLKIQRHLHYLEQSGLDTSFLQLNIHDEIFELIGLDESIINESLRDWYHSISERAFEFDIFKEERKLLEIATDILVALNKKQFTSQRRE